MRRLEILLPGRRKATYGTAAFVALCVGAWALKASFAEFRDGLAFWLGTMVASHVAQQATAKQPEVTS